MIVNEQIALRDYFAAKAMAALIATKLRNWPKVETCGVSQAAYEIADHMIKEREKCPPTER